MALTPEAAAREKVDGLLEAAGWCVQNAADVNLGAARGVAIREFPLKKGHGFADYLLYVDRKAVGVVEAKKEGETLTGVEVQATKYSDGIPVPEHRRRDAVHQQARSGAAKPAGVPVPPAGDAGALTPRPPLPCAGEGESTSISGAGEGESTCISGARD